MSGAAPAAAVSFDPDGDVQMDGAEVAEVSTRGAVVGAEVALAQVTAEPDDAEKCGGAGVQPASTAGKGAVFAAIDGGHIHNILLHRPASFQLKDPDICTCKP